MQAFIIFSARLWCSWWRRRDGDNRVYLPVLFFAEAIHALAVTSLQPPDDLKGLFGQAQSLFVHRNASVLL